MKKANLVIAMSFCLFMFPVVVLAQSNQQVQRGVSQYGVQPQTNSQYSVRNDLDNFVAPQGNQVQNQNQVVAQNQGEDSCLQVATQQIQKLMEMDIVDEEVGEKLGAVAQKQVQAQAQIQSQLDKLESRSRHVKALIGPNYKAIENIKRQIEQNELRISELQQLQTQVKSQADLSQIQEAVLALVAQNTALQQRLQTEENVGSLFGWLIRLFN